MKSDWRQRMQRQLARSTILSSAVLGLASLTLAAELDPTKLPPAATASVDFAKQIQPLLENHCLKCHGDDKPKGGYSLTTRDAALHVGDWGANIIPGDSAKSPLVHYVARVVEDMEMPPPDKGEPLTKAQVALLRAWIDQGAKWPEAEAEKVADNRASHWAFQKPVRPEPPVTKNRKWAHNPIDGFILAQLEAHHLKPSTEADKITLIRRLSLDLIGLPPTPEEVDAFLADRSKDAYEKLVERLLASPHYGEKWARHWLDAARYADSNGFEKDRTRSIWPWRDWVINAINRDLPFDQFTIEQLAGDLLPNSTEEQRIATGFLRNSMHNMEGGIEPEKFRTEAMIDRVDAVGRTWLGLTVACAQCHTHKYDPITHKEYYEFYAFLNQDDEPKLEVPNAEQKLKRAAILSKVRGLEDKWMSETPDQTVKMAAWEQEIAGAVGDWQIIDTKEWHSQPMKFEKQEDLSLLGGGDIYNNSVLRVWVDTTETNITGFRLEALNNANLPFNGPGIDGNGQFQLCEFTVEAIPLAELSKPTDTNTVITTNKVVFKRALADAEAPGWEVAQAINGVNDDAGWATDFTKGRRNQERRAVFEAEQPVGFAGGTRLLITLYSKPKESKLSNFQLGRVRMSYTTSHEPLRVDPLSEKQRALLAIPVAQRTPAQQRELFRVYRFSNAAFAEANKEWDLAWKDWPNAESTTLVLQEREVPRKTHIFRRGDWLKPTTEVTANVPAVLNPLPKNAPPNRLGLAQWIVDPANPLTARVTMNRVWQQYFGQGLVPTPEDFGTRADKPSHPELLDWLATEFIAQKWSLKAMHRLIVSSATYRQSSRVTPDLLEVDPYNRWLARAPRFRVDAETIQDIALRSSGLLSEKIGGPSVFPVLPDGVMQLSYGPIPWNVSEGEDRYRRAMYTFWKRSVPFPAMVSFDAPSAEQSCVRRVRSNTPLQALVTLNEPTFNNAARWLAWRTLSEGGKSESEKLTYAFRHCLSRPPSEKELKVLSGLLDDAEKEFADKPKDAGSFAFSDPKNPAPLPTGATLPQLAAWTTVTRALLNLDETLTKE